MIVMRSLVLFALKHLKVAKTATHVLYYFSFKPNNLSCENTLTTKIVEKMFQVMMLNH